MSIKQYQAAQTATEDARQTEYRLFAEVTRALLAMREDDDHQRFVRAVHWNRRLWLALQADCAADDNRLPEEIRAGIISLAIWVDKYSRQVLNQQADLQPLIEVNRNIMVGLAGSSPTDDPSADERQRTERGNEEVRIG